MATNKDLENVARRIHGFSVELGIMPKGAASVLENGNSTTGISYRLFADVPGVSSRENHPAFNSSFLGKTRGAALEKLYTISETLFSVVTALERRARSKE